MASTCWLVHKRHLTSNSTRPNAKCDLSLTHPATAQQTFRHVRLTPGCILFRRQMACFREAAQAARANVAAKDMDQLRSLRVQKEEMEVPSGWETGETEGDASASCCTTSDWARTEGRGGQEKPPLFTPGCVTREQGARKNGPLSLTSVFTLGKCGFKIARVQVLYPVHVRAVQAMHIVYLQRADGGGEAE